MRRLGEQVFQAKGLGGARFGPHSKPELITRCRDIREYVETRHLAPPEEIAAVWPPKKTANLWAWVYCYAQLVRFLEREKTAPDKDAADRTALAMLAEEPVSVLLDGGRQVQVYPKSFYALQWFAEQDQLLDWLYEREGVLRGEFESGRLERSITDAPVGLLERVVLEQADVLIRLATQACTPDAAIAPDADTAPFRDLSPIDLIRIHAAFVEVNAGRIVALKALRPRRTKGDEAPMPWSVLLATAADVWKVDATTLVRDRAFTALLARIALSAARPEVVEIA
jgi:hypothetical protein